MRILICNGRIIDPASACDTVGDLALSDGIVAGLGAAPEGFVPDQRIDATGLVVCPGLVDLSARLREPGYEYRGSLEAELAAAVAGGVTSLVCPPDTDPPLDEPGLVEMLKFRARNLHLTRVWPLGALTARLGGERLTEMAELADAGCIGFSQGNTSIVDAAVLMNAMDYATSFGFPVWLRPRDASLGRNGVAHDGEVAARLGLAGIPAASETVAVATALLLARETGARLHLCRISCARSLELIRMAREEGLAVSCDVAAHHLHLTERDIGSFNPYCRVDPPFRALADREALAAAAADGTIDAICSDHAPVDKDGKVTTFAEAEPGVTGLELLLSLTLRWQQALGLPLTTAIARVTSDAARVAGIRAGSIAPGQPADVCVFDPGAWWTVSAHTLRSQGRNTPFRGLEVPGVVRCTLVEGRLVYAAPDSA